MNDAAV